MNKIFYILIFFTLTISLSAQSKSKDVLVFEINKTNRPGPRVYSSNTFYFYQSGRIACKDELTDLRGKLHKRNKSKCFQISRAKMDELSELAEQADFQSAADSYIFFSGGVDWGKHLSLSYLGKSGKKEIRLTNARQSKNNASLPPSLEKFLQKIGEIDKALKIETEQ
jgi:hypothetical protein